MKQYLLALVLAITLAIHFAPGRLMILAGETVVSSPERRHITADDSLYWQAIHLQDRLEGNGWTVKYTTLLPVYFGLTTFEDRLIRVETSLHWSDRYQILLHEAAHAYQPAWLGGGTPEAEIFAESVATLVCHCGYRDSARYLAGVKTLVPVMFLYQRDIYRVANFLTP